MNKSFLSFVAQDIIRKFGCNLSRIAVVLPNRRTSLFLNEQLAKCAGKPIWSPAAITISDLFRRHSNRVVADPIKLVCELYRSFVAQTGSNETLDHFYGWGQLLLADFDDIDKNMADAQKVFANLRDLHELDDVSYLTPEQKDLLKSFFSNFSDDHNSELKQRFLNLWSRFGDIYVDFNERLAQQGLAYEGALYRQVVGNEEIQFEYQIYLFIGFNMLQNVEQQLFERLRKEGRARFYWDFDRYYMPGDNEKSAHEAGYYIAQYLEHFPNELDISNDEIYRTFEKQKKITFVSAATEHIQARYVGDWLLTDQRYADGKKTAIVLCDENLLQVVIHCLPPVVGKVNITTGYPLSQTPVSSFVRQALQLQTVQNRRYRIQLAKRLAKHPYSKYLDSIDSVATLNDHPATDMQWLLALLKEMACGAKENSDPLFKESLFRMYTLLNRLSQLIVNGDLTVDGNTLQRLVAQLIHTTSIPFHGEPAEGVQVMGVLETRNLDFDHLLILSCNDGNIPKGINDTSFIPYSIRKAYGLTTVDHKTAIYSYYFHRLLQRASDVTFVYNNSADDVHTGEMSRFMLQLMVESGHQVLHETLQAGQTPLPARRHAIEKDHDVLRVLQGIQKLSPSAINKYMRCQLQFYYNYIKNLKEPDNKDEEYVDGRSFGNIFHRSSQLIYERMMQRCSQIRKVDVEEVLKHPETIEMVVDQAFQEEIAKIRDGGNVGSVDYNGLQLINRAVIISYLKQLLKIDMSLAPFSILALEKDVYSQFSVTTSAGTHELKIGGFIDRLDAVTLPSGSSRIRVVDYKTGRKVLQKINTLEEVFSPENVQTKHSDYYLQTLIYSYIVRFSDKWNAASLPVSPALLFIQQTAANDYDPTLTFGSETIDDIGTWAEEFKQHLIALLQEIFEPQIPFSPTADATRCTYCPYRHLCGL